MLGIKNTDHGIQLTVENIKCGGCAKTITNAMKELNFENINVDPATQSIEMSAPQSEEQLHYALKKLKSLGYPLVASEEGLKALALKAKSFVSCAIGKIS